MEKLEAVRREGLKTNLPDFRPGDTVKVMVRVREGEKERLQAFEGVCIGRRGSGLNASFTRSNSACKRPSRTGPLSSNAAGPIRDNSWQISIKGKAPTCPALPFKAWAMSRKRP